MTLLHIDTIDMIQDRAEVLKLAEAKKIVRKYNQVAEVLIKYEMLYHQAWLMSVEACREGMS